MEMTNAQFQGFSPPAFVVTYFKDLLETIQNESPHGATVRADIHRRDKDYRVNLQIHSAAGSFFVSAEGARVTELGRKLLVRARRQLNKWKSNRFTHETIRHGGSHASG